MDPDVEDVDLAQIAADLRGVFESAPPTGYVRGRTAIRDAVVARLGFSEAVAERLVETMVGRGFIRFEGDPARADTGDSVWTFGESG
jgi:hypothetical protein